jgi:hypothetical protein
LQNTIVHPYFLNDTIFFEMNERILRILKTIHSTSQEKIMRPCHTCGQHLLSTTTTCPHCSGPKPSTRTTIALGILLGIGSVGCGDKDDDTSADDTATVEEPASEPDMAAEYGVPSE